MSTAGTVGALDRAHLATLVAVLRHGSFDHAARALHVTPSAVSQRMKQLEETVGGIVVVRGAQARATKLGEALFRHGLQLELLESELAASLSGSTPHAAPINIAVNADSLATWITPALMAFSQKNDQAVEVLADDQDHTSHWLQTGRVLGAVTTQAKAVQGCRVLPLGAMKYRATSSPAFIKRFFPSGVTPPALRTAPLVTYDRKDLLHELFIKAMGLRAQASPKHFLPSPEAIVKACVAGVAWAINPEALVLRHIANGRLVDLKPGASVSVPLYWQCWSMSSHTLDELTRALQSHAARDLAV